MQAARNTVNLNQLPKRVGRPLFSAKNLCDFFDSVPIACSGRHTEKLFDFSEVTDRLHLPAIHTQDEPVLDSNDLQ